MLKELRITKNERNKEILRKGFLKKSSIRATLCELKNWRGFRPYLVTLWKEFEISFKHGVFKIFERVNCPGQFSGSCPN